MYDLIIALAYIGLIIAPAIVAARCNPKRRGIPDKAGQFLVSLRAFPGSCVVGSCVFLPRQETAASAASNPASKLPSVLPAGTLWIGGRVMLVVMKAQATPEEIQAVCEHIVQLGFRAHPLPGAQRTAIGITGNQGEVDRGNLESLPGVAEVIRVSKAYKLASRDVKEEDTVIRFAGPDAAIGGRDLAVVAGPCSIESREQAFAIAEQVAAAGAQFFRGGAYKPRTSPYAFQGLGLEALQIMAEIREKFGLRIVTEALDAELLDPAAEWADVIQIGARNMQNFSLLKKAGPAAQAGAGQARIERHAGRIPDGRRVRDERGQLRSDSVRARRAHLCRPRAQHAGPEHYSRRAAVSHLPILVDPSHGTGRRDSVLPMARAAVAAGADGVMVEVHNHPENALSDGPQSIYPEQFAR